MFIYIYIYNNIIKLLLLLRVYLSIYNFLLNNNVAFIYLSMVDTKSTLLSSKLAYNAMAKQDFKYFFWNDE
jgi:hypothetical protein